MDDFIISTKYKIVLRPVGNTEPFNYRFNYQMIGTEILQGSTINEIIRSNSPLNNKQICKGTLSRQYFFSGKFFNLWCIKLDLITFKTNQMFDIN